MPYCKNMGVAENSSSCSSCSFVLILLIAGRNRIYLEMQSLKSDKSRKWVMGDVTPKLTPKFATNPP